MGPTTRLEAELFNNSQYWFVRSIGGSPSEIQTTLDAIATEVCQEVGPAALVAHMRTVYDKSAEAYKGNPEHLHVPDVLLTFMNYLSDGEYVLDLGCGYGRDAVFMALRDWKLRQEFMGRMKDGRTAFERIGLPTKSFRVAGIDASVKMESAANQLAQAHGLHIAPLSSADTIFLGGVDMHDLQSICSDGMFDGVWSSAALFLHTPQAFIQPALEGVARALRSGGIFGVSYANNLAGLPYDNLRYSRTGEIKYFSRPTPAKITRVAHDCGLALFQQDFSDFEMSGKVQKDFFATQFFQKN